MTSPRTPEESSKANNDSSRVLQGERIGKLENQFSRLLGMGTIVGVVFTVFSVTIFTIFYR